MGTVSYYMAQKPFMYSAKWIYVTLDASNNILGFGNNLLQDANNRGL